jgi:hypothetical protein
MKCPKCGYHSFDHLDNCRKCSADLTEHKVKFNLRGFFAPWQAAQTEPEATAVEDSEKAEVSSEETADLGFDFLEEGEDATSLGNDKEDVNIDQPFGADSETIPADAPSFAEDDDNKPGKGPEFSF